VKSYLRIGTRGSPLAQAQAQWVAQRLRASDPALNTTLVTIRTSGDRIIDRPLSEVGGKGLFVKEIETALLAGEVDCAVHSMKDLPGDLAPGLVIAAVPEREDPTDVVLTRRGGGLDGLPQGAVVGTSSLRRMALALAQRPDLKVCSLRGNVGTRILRLTEGKVDAVLLARAGLRRLGIEYPHVDAVDPREFLPAVGQGALGIETRVDGFAELVAKIDDGASRVAVEAERAFLARVGGSCVTPLAAHATLERGLLTLRALIAKPDGSRVIRGETSGPATEGTKLGADLAERLLSQGGAEILRGLVPGS
jgi:hydroxymethylbilane synthase